jgi:hypothetical protein
MLSTVDQNENLKRVHVNRGSSFDSLSPPIESFEAITMSGGRPNHEGPSTNDEAGRGRSGSSSSLVPQEDAGDGRIEEDRTSKNKNDASHRTRSGPPAGVDDRLLYFKPGSSHQHQHDARRAGDAWSNRRGRRRGAPSNSGERSDGAGGGAAPAAAGSSRPSTPDSAAAIAAARAAVGLMPDPGDGSAAEATTSPKEKECIVGGAGDDDGDEEFEAEIPSTVPVSAARPLGRRVSLHHRRKRTSLLLAAQSDARSTSSLLSVGSGLPSAASGAASVTIPRSVNVRHEGTLGVDVELDAAPPPPPDAAHRQASWYADALRSGMSERELAAALGLPDPAVTESNVEDDRRVLHRGGGGVGTPATADPDRDGDDQASDLFDSDEVLEQHRILAIHEARRLVEERLGKDFREPVRRGSRRRTDEEERLERERSKTQFPVSKPDPVVVPPDLFADFGKMIRSGDCLPKRIPPPKNMPVPPRQVNLATGRVVAAAAAAAAAGGGGGDRSSHDAADAGNEGEEEVRVKCRGCRKLLAVSYLAIFVECPECGARSPAMANFQESR